MNGTSKEKDQAMLHEALLRLADQAQALDKLIAQGAPQHPLIVALCELSYTAGKCQGAAALYVPRWAPVEEREDH